MRHGNTICLMKRLVNYLESLSLNTEKIKWEDSLLEEKWRELTGSDLPNGENSFTITTGFKDFSRLILLWYKSSVVLWKCSMYEWADGIYISILQKDITKMQKIISGDFERNRDYELIIESAPSSISIFDVYGGPQAYMEISNDNKVFLKMGMWKKVYTITNPDFPVAISFMLGNPCKLVAEDSERELNTITVSTCNPRDTGKIDLIFNRLKD
jgi:hypothetical protein